MADIAPPDQRGAAFGKRQSLDTVGAFLGPLAAMALIWTTTNQFRTVFWVAVVPGLASSLLITLNLIEPPHRRPKPVWHPLRRSELAGHSRRYWQVVEVATLFTLARFNEGFLILRAQSLAIPDDLIPGVLVVMNVAYALSAYPVGRLSDRLDRLQLLLRGPALLVVADLVLTPASDVPGPLAVAVIWGAAHGLLSVLVADEAPEDPRGTAFGVFILITGIALPLASAIAGGSGLLQDRRPRSRQARFSPHSQASGSSRCGGAGRALEVWHEVPGSVSVSCGPPAAQLDGWKFHGSRSSMRLWGWP